MSVELLQYRLRVRPRERHRAVLAQKSLLSRLRRASAASAAAAAAAAASSSPSSVTVTTVAAPRAADAVAPLGVRVRGGG